MKARNLFLTAITLWLLSLGNLAFANDDQTMAPAPEVVNVNINTASAETLAENLTGVGLSRAQAIVAYRESFGPFYSAEELTAVKGIGKGTVEKNAARIVIE
ncbi:MAG: ComEA family DNA-binding protein [Pseudomonadales bacterium]|jgi:competence protein ComEA